MILICADRKNVIITADGPKTPLKWTVKNISLSSNKTHNKTDKSKQKQE